MQETWVQSLDLADQSLEEGMATHSSILPGKYPGQRSLAGYSPCCCKELNTTERLTHTFVLTATSSSSFLIIGPRGTI